MIIVLKYYVSQETKAEVYYQLVQHGVNQTTI